MSIAPSRGSKLERSNMLKGLIQSKSITPSGADWLTTRIDPYHDFNRPIAGYPDSDSFDTVVSVLNYSMDVSQPTGLGANWDAHIFTMPFDYNVGYLGTSVNGQITSSAARYDAGLVTVVKDASGNPLFPTANPVASANFSMTPVSGFSELTAGLSRVIALGIEIQDTTAEVYRQGSVTCYTTPTINTGFTDIGVLDAGGNMQSNNSYQVIPSPPSTVGQAIIYRTSTQWEARDGAYLVVGQQGIDNPFTLAHRTGFCITPDPRLDGTDVVLATPAVNTVLFQAPPALTSSTIGQEAKSINVTQSGIFMNGLSEHATFKIRVRVYVERAPLRYDTSLVPLASPSAPYDPKAIMLYSHIMQQMPIAVPVGYNAHGDWWRMLANVIGRVAPPLGMALSPYLGPGATLIGQGIGTLAKQVNAKKKKVNKNNKINPNMRKRLNLTDSAD